MVGIEDPTDYELNLDMLEKKARRQRFDLGFFEEVYRNNAGIYPAREGQRRVSLENPDGTARWKLVPDVYVDVSSFEKLKKEDSNAPSYEGYFRPQIILNVSQHLPNQTDGHFLGSRLIEVHNNEPMPKAGTRGVVLVRGGDADGGVGVFDVWIKPSGQIYSAEVIYSADASPGTIAVELGQISGPLRDASGSGSKSLYYDGRRVSAPQTLDEINGMFLYRRPWAARSGETGDDITHLSPLVPAPNSSSNN